MRERSEQILRMVCLALAALLFARLVVVGLRVNPLGRVAIPEVPTLPGNTNAVAKGTNTTSAGVSAKTGTNMLERPADAKTGAPPKARTNAGIADNAPAGGPTSNEVAGAEAAPAGTNTIPGTNLVMAADQAGSATNTTRARKPKKKGTNIVAVASAELPANAAQETSAQLTNLPPGAIGTNLALMKSLSGTNTLSPEDLAKLGANGPGLNLRAGRRRGPGGADMAMAGMPGRGPRAKAPELPPEIQARVIKVTDSEILGQVMHPLPMGLLGIAGNVALLRSPSGQTGLVKEGDSLGEIKLLRIGTNRVLIERDGQREELMMFSGFGGDSLLPKTTESTNETTHP